MHVLKYKSFYGKKTLPYVMPLEKSVNIDHKIDFELANLLMQNIENEYK